MGTMPVACCESSAAAGETMTKMLSAGLCCTSPVTSVITLQRVYYSVIDGTNRVILIFSGYHNYFRNDMTGARYAILGMRSK